MGDITYTEGRDQGVSSSVIITIINSSLLRVKLVYVNTVICYDLLWAYGMLFRSFVRPFTHSYIHPFAYSSGFRKLWPTCAGGEVWDVAELERVGVREKFDHSAEPGAADDADRRPMVSSTEQELCRRRRIFVAAEDRVQAVRQ